MNEMEYRRAPGTLVGDVGDVDGPAVLVKFPAATTDKHMSQFHYRCFSDSLARHLPPMLAHHNPSDPIGKAVRYQILPDRLELVNKFSDLDAVPSARRVHAQIADGSCRGFSFGFSDGHSVQLRSEKGVRMYVRADLRETSPVVFPSIPGAEAVGLRSEGSADRAHHGGNFVEAIAAALEWAGHDRGEAKRLAVAACRRFAEVGTPAVKAAAKAGMAGSSTHVDEAMVKAAMDYIESSDLRAWLPEVATVPQLDALLGGRPAVRIRRREPTPYGGSGS